MLDANGSAPRVVIYARQSEQRPGEDAKTSLSLRSQEERGKAWVASIGGTVAQVITDHDLRGADADRPGIKTLLDAVKSQRVDIVWLFALSRLARDLILQLMICREIERAGVGRIVSDTEGGIDDPFIRGIYGLMNENATRQTSAHLKNAFARRARDGGFPTGPTPTGFRRPHTITIHRANGTSYERQTGEPLIDPDGAAIILDLFTRFDAGESIHTLAESMAALGPGPRGGQWERSTVRAMLQSPIYTGDIAHHGQVVAHNDAWQIVPRDLFDRVQAKLSRAPVIRRNQIDSWLEGYVTHVCGQRMYWQSYSKGSGGMFVCRGLGKTMTVHCTEPRKIIGGQLLETAVRRCLVADFAGVRTPAEALTIAQERSGGTSVVKHRARLDKRLSDAQARWQRMSSRYAVGKLPGDVMDVEDELLATAEREHAEAVAALPKPQSLAAIEQMSQQLSTMTEVIAETSGDRLRTLLATLGTVYVSEHGVRVVYLPEVAPHLPGVVIAVPRGGKGFR